MKNIKLRTTHSIYSSLSDRFLPQYTNTNYTNPVRNSLVNSFGFRLFGRLLNILHDRLYIIEGA